MRRGFLKYSLLLFLFLQALSTATIRYVSKTGTSTPPFLTWETASDSIQKCLNICNNGDTVIVANGVYKEFLEINNSITLIGSSMDSCVIDGRGLGERDAIIANSFIKIQGFNIIGKDVNDYYQVITSWSDSIEVKSCRLSNCGAGLSLYSGYMEDLIMTNVNTGVANFCITGNCNPTIRNSIIIINDNGDTRIAFYNQYGGEATVISCIFIAMGRATGGIYHGPIYRLTAKNNLIAGFNMNIHADVDGDSSYIINNITRDYKLLPGHSTFASIYNVFSNCILKNNIIINNHVGVKFLTAPAQSNYNLYYNNITDVNSGIGIGENDVFADPMFVKDTIAKSLQYDYHLQMFSPGINAGDPDILDPDGSRSDIGMYGGPLGMTYNYRDLPPKPPKDFTVNLDTSTGFLNVVWSKYTEADFSHYKVHKSPAAGFTPDSSNLFTVTDTSFFSDTLSLTGDKFYYKVISVDSGGSFSPPGPEIAVEISDLNEPEIRITDEYQLYQNYPNPFNSSTKIPFSLSEKGKVRIVVYDIKGEVIKELINREIEKGYHEADLDMGQMNLSSGIYLYRIEVTGKGRIPRYMTMRKMVYLK